MCFKEEVRRNTGGDLVNLFALALTGVEKQWGAIKIAEYAGGMIGNLALMIKMHAPPEEWRDATKILVEEINNQMTAH